MIKQIQLSISITLILASVCLAQWTPLNKFSIPNSPPDVQLISDDGISTIIKVELPGFQINEFIADGKTYHSISFESEALSTEVGFPEIPYIAKILAIPDQGSVSIEILETSSVQTFKGINLPPARESWFEGKPETPYLENIDAYNSENIYPDKFARVEEPAVFRDFRIARVSVYPIRYSPSKKEIQVTSSITVKINYVPGSGINPKTTPNHPIAPSFAKLYRNFIFNYNEVLTRKYAGREDGYDMMLCIMPDELYASFQVYADWKHKTGTFIHSTKFSEIGASANNPTAVKNHILDAYNNWEVPPTHVLIVGDDGFAPVSYVTLQGWNFVNEDYFVELEGNDYFPEMMIGRFTNQGDYRMQVMINKFMNYEKTPYVQSIDWFKKGLVCANNAYASQRYTKRFTAQEMLVHGNFLNVDSLYNGYPCQGNVSTIVNMINAGRSYLNYRGEGWTSGWATDCFPFDVSDVSSLNNGAKLTFVTSIGCGVAMFDANGGNCFGEEWVEMGTPTEPRGGCAFIGPTSNTHTTYNNKIDMGIYIGMFEQGIDSPGEALITGKMYMFLVFGNTDWVKYHFKIYCALGDPSLHVWKNVPQNIIVSYPDTVITGFNQVQVSVTYTGSEIPVENAQVCISGTDVYTVGYTDENGSVMLNITTTSAGELSLAVRGGTVIPFQGNVQIITGVENVALDGDPAVTDLDGNDDGLINPNENCTIIFTLKNYGTQIANNVSATLTIPDTIDNIQIITTTPVSFGNIAPNQSVTGAPFQFFIEPECPVGFTIPFELNVTSSTSNWVYYQNELVHGCQLQYSTYFVDDEGNILRNFRMDPGETVKVVLEIVNQGDDIAPEVKGSIQSSDPYLTILDSTGFFGTLLVDSSASNEEDYFVVQVSNNCPVQYDASYSLSLSTQNGLYPYSTTVPFSIPVAMPSGYDPTGPDEYGYYAYSSDDVLFEQSPQFNWIEINAIGTLIPKPTGVSDFTQPVNLPFTFKYYGNNFSQIRISSDGWAALGSGTQTASENFPLPHPDDINNMICAFWDDLYSNDPAETGKLYYYNDADNHRFIIEWDQVGHADDYTNVETFEIIILDPLHYPTQTGDGEIICQYKTVAEPGSCSIGLEDFTELIGLQYVFDEIYEITATEVRDQYALKFTTAIPTIVSVKDENETTVLPTKYVLEQNYPNPFNPETRIKYSIPEPSYVKLNIFDINGTLVKSIQDGNQSAGTYEAVWDGKNSIGNKVGSGVYFFKIQANEFAQVKKMILLK